MIDFLKFAKSIFHAEILTNLAIPNNLQCSYDKFLKNFKNPPPKKSPLNLALKSQPPNSRGINTFILQNIDYQKNQYFNENKKLSPV